MEFKSKYNLGETVFYLDEDCALDLKCGVVESVLVEANKEGELVYNYNMGDKYFVLESQICATLDEAEEMFGIKKLA